MSIIQLTFFEIFVPKDRRSHNRNILAGILQKLFIIPYHSWMHLKADIASYITKNYCHTKNVFWDICAQKIDNYREVPKTDRFMTIYINLPQAICFHPVKWLLEISSRLGGVRQQMISSHPTICRNKLTKVCGDQVYNC